MTALISRPSEGSEVGIIALQGSENVADLYELFDKHPRTRFVFLARHFPPDAALARVAAKHGSQFISRRQPSVVIAATVIAMSVQAGMAS